MTPFALWLVLACHKAPPVQPAPPPPEPEEAKVAPAGEVIDGRFVDSRAQFSVEVPAGWEVRPGTDDRPLRVVLVHPATGTRVEVWSYEESSATPRPRPGCAWTFEDSGPYQALRVREELLVATCRPHDPRDPHVLGVYLSRDGRSWHIETVVPEGALGVGPEAAEAVLMSMRFGG